MASIDEKMKLVRQEFRLQKEKTLVDHYGTCLKYKGHFDAASFMAGAGCSLAIFIVVVAMLASSH